MMKYRRFIVVLLFAGWIATTLSQPGHAASRTAAGHAYRAASRCLIALKGSPGKKKFRSSWIDCIDAFEGVEKRYPKSWYAGDACFLRADIYRQLYQRSLSGKDIDLSSATYAGCRSSYPKHARAPEALYRVIEIALSYKNDPSRAADAYGLLDKSYPRSAWKSRAERLLKQEAPGEFAKRKRALQITREKQTPKTVVENIRYRSGRDYTRIVIDHERKAKFRALELKGPPRLVFDLLHARLGPHISREPLTINDGILRQVRTSQHGNDTVRVVLDLADIGSYAVFPLRDPERLVIDISGNGDKASGFHSSGAGIGAPQKWRGHVPPEAGSTLSLSRQLGLKIRTIAIDAGHGGHDPGAMSRRGTKEKNITLDIAKRLATLVKEGDLGCRVVMTRDRDEFIPLEDRPAIARTKGADLFVSIHVNATRRRGARGIETYIQGLRPSDREAMETASNENAATVRTLGELDDELTKILTGLRMESNDEDSIHLAHEVHESLLEAVSPIQGRVRDLGVKRAFFYVLINTGMPSILVEVGFISNPAEEMLLRKGKYRQAIAEAIYEGLKKYVQSREVQA